MEGNIETLLTSLRPIILAMTKKFFKATGLRRDPEDVAHDVLVRLWTAYNNNTEISNPEAWAVMVTKNLCISILRKENKRGVLSLSDSLPAKDTASFGLETDENADAEHF